MEMEAKGLSCSGEEMQPHHSHMFDKISLEVVECQVQDVATSAEALFYQKSRYTRRLVSYTNHHIL